MQPTCSLEPRKRTQARKKFPVMSHLLQFQHLHLLRLPRHCLPRQCQHQQSRANQFQRTSNANCLSGCWKRKGRSNQKMRKRRSGLMRRKQFSNNSSEQNPSQISNWKHLQKHGIRVDCFCIPVMKFRFHWCFISGCFLMKSCKNPFSLTFLRFFSSTVPSFDSKVRSMTQVWRIALNQPTY